MCPVQCVTYVSGRSRKIHVDSAVLAHLASPDLCPFDPGFAPILRPSFSGQRASVRRSSDATQEEAQTYRHAARANTPARQDKAPGQSCYRSWIQPEARPASPLIRLLNPFVKLPLNCSRATD